MRHGGVFNIVNRTHSCIDCRIKANGIICTANIQINGRGDPDDFDTLLSQIQGSPERPVSADNYYNTFVILIKKEFLVNIRFCDYNVLICITVPGRHILPFLCRSEYNLKDEVPEDGHNK